MGRRVRKPDGSALRRLMGAAATGDRTYRAIQNHLVEYDRVVSDYERRWGVERLPLLVTPELRDRFWAQMDKLNAAIAADNPGEVEHQVAVTLRAYAKLEQVARELGGQELSGDCWTAPMPDGRVLAVAQSDKEVGRVKRDLPQAVVYSVEELARIIPAWEADQAETIRAVKDVFPDATVTAVKVTKEELNDEIPF